MDKMPFQCGTDDSYEPYEQEEIETTAEQRALSDCVRLYLEVDNDIYQDKGNSVAVTDYVTGLFNQVSTMYANENINTSLIEIPNDFAFSRSSVISYCGTAVFSVLLTIVNSGRFLAASITF